MAIFCNVSSFSQIQKSPPKFIFGALKGWCLYVFLWKFNFLWKLFKSYILFQNPKFFLCKISKIFLQKLTQNMDKNKERKTDSLRRKRRKNRGNSPIRSNSRSPVRHRHKRSKWKKKERVGPRTARNKGYIFCKILDFFRMVLQGKGQ